MNKIFVVLLIACGFLSAMEQKPLLTITPIEHQVLGYASKTGKIITTKEFPNASLDDVAVSPSGEFLAIMNGEWLNIARVGEKGTVAIGEPVRIKKFAGSLLFLDYVRFLVFCENSFHEYEISNADEHLAHHLSRIAETPYGGERVSFVKKDTREPGILSPTLCIIPLVTEIVFFRVFKKDFNTWKFEDSWLKIVPVSGDQVPQINSISSMSKGAYAIGDTGAGLIQWFYPSEEKGGYSVSHFNEKELCAVFACPKFLVIGYNEVSVSKLYDMSSSTPYCRATIPIIGASIRKIFWKDDCSQCLIVSRDKKASAYLISEIPIDLDSND